MLEWLHSMYLNHSWSSQTLWTTVGIDCPNSNPTKICNLHSSEVIEFIVKPVFMVARSNDVLLQCIRSSQTYFQPNLLLWTPYCHNTTNPVMTVVPVHSFPKSLTFNRIQWTSLLLPPTPHWSILRHLNWKSIVWVSISLKSNQKAAQDLFSSFM